jgi:hypothetical protein
MLRGLSVALLSLAAHAAVIAAPSLPGRWRRALGAPDRVAPAQRGLAARASLAKTRASIAGERRVLIDEARAARARGALALGAFLLEANALDAREEGRAFDVARAKERYRARLEALRARLVEEGARDAVPAVFGDLRYYGRPGGRMGDALLEGGGACEPLSQLLVASLHDTGRGASAALRYYGGSSDGVTHLAPLVVEEGVEWDLLTGGRAQRSGSLFSPVDLVEVYARAHGLAPALPELPRDGEGGARLVGEPAAPLPEASTWSAGYPPNRDRFPGSIPLFQSRAVPPPAEASAVPALLPDPHDQALECAFFVRMAVLDPPRVRLGEWVGGSPRRAGAPAVELRRVPTAVQLDRTLSMIRAVEQTMAEEGSAPRSPGAARSGSDDADRLMGLSCLVALYDRASVDLTFAGEREMAKVAVTKKREAEATGKALLEGVSFGSAEGRALLARLAERHAGRNWLLLVLPGGSAPVMRLVEGAAKEDWGRINALAALVVAPSTRQRAIELLGRRPRAEQVDVMHEVFHAHDHLRPWASNYALDDGAEDPLAAAEFSRAYRVFRGLSWGLWEGARPMEALLAQLVAETERAGLGRAWEAAFLEYYGRNALNLRASRPDALPFARALARFLREHGHQTLEVYQSRLADLGE